MAYREGEPRPGPRRSVINGRTYALYKELVELAREQYGVGPSEIADYKHISSTSAVGERARIFGKVKLAKFVENRIISRAPVAADARFILRLITNCPNAVAWRAKHKFQKDRYWERLTQERGAIKNIHDQPEAVLFFDPMEAPTIFPRADVHPRDVELLAEMILDQIESRVRARQKATGRRERPIPKDVVSAIESIRAECSGAYISWIRVQLEPGEPDAHGAELLDQIRRKYAARNVANVAAHG